MIDLRITIQGDFHAIKLYDLDGKMINPGLSLLRVSFDTT